MRNLKTNTLLFGILFYLFVGCEKLSEQDIYKRPDWLPGKLYTSVAAQENLSLFAECIHLTGLDSIIDVSGSWTVFAPTNEAIQQFLTENHYSKITEIPLLELEKICKFHIVQNPWTMDQLQSLSPYGWRSGNSNNSYSYAYKRQTILKNPNEKYWINKTEDKDRIVLDSTGADTYKMVYAESRKYVPIFYDDYLVKNELTPADYLYYFDRIYEPGNIYYAGAKILQGDIFAENGFVHIIDRLVNPMLNAKEILKKERSDESYQLFMELAQWYFPNFEPNLVATFNQPAYRLGGIVDTLWDLNYELNFDLQKEQIGYVGGNVNETLVKHNGFFAPTDDAFLQFIDGTLTAQSGFPHWRNYQSLPIDVAEIIVSPHFKSEPIYPSKNVYKQIFREEGGFHQNEDDIIRKEFGSNSTFIGLSSYIPDRVFTSVTAPVFLRPSYTIFRLAMLYAGVDDDIAYRNDELLFFPIPDYILKYDSSMLINWIDKDQNRYNFQAYDRLRRQMVDLGRNTIRDWILNQAGTSESTGIDNKERIRTLRGRYITWDHTANTIQGSRSSTFGYNSNINITVYPTLLKEPMDNGKSWAVNSWFNF